jgi:hypothetical protein
MILNDLNKGTTFFIETSLDSKCISNEKSEKLLSLEFDWISSWNLQIWMKHGQETCVCT